jgi:hypothetical protein
MTYLRLPLNVGSSLPRNLCARVLCHLLHQQVDALLRAPARHPRRGRGRGGYAKCGSRRNDDVAAPRAASNDSSTLAARCGPSAMSGNCIGTDCFLVESLHHRGSHRLTTRVRLPLVGLQKENVVIATSPHHGGFFIGNRRLRRRQVPIAVSNGGSGIVLTKVLGGIYF